MSVLRAVVLSVLSAVVASLLLAAAPAQARIVDRDCSDFDTQAQAQRFFLDHDPRNDPHRLDADGDGVVCESLPCPCLNTPPSSGGTQGTVVRTRVRIIKVVDGDTVNVRLPSGRLASVRLIGVNTPERGECGYDRATRVLRGKTPIGTRVTLVSDPSQALHDRYGRLLRYVMKGTRDINRSQLVAGVARVYVYNYEPFRRASTYRAAMRAARDANRALWASCW